jgi:hypothetical protein
MLRRLLSSIKPNGTSYTARTTAFATATGISDVTILGALNTFDLGLISNGLDSKMIAIYPFVGGTSSTHKYNFMDSRDLNGAYRLTLSGGLTHSSNGILSNGTNGYCDTNINSSTALYLDDVHYSFYSRTNISEVVVELGNLLAYPNHLRVGANGTIDIPSIVMGFTSTSDTRGFWTVNKTASNSRNVSKNGTIEASDTSTNSAILNNYNMYLLARNDGGTASYFSNKQCAFSSFGKGLTSGQLSTFYSLVQALQTSLSRQV